MPMNCSLRDYRSKVLMSQIYISFIAYCGNLMTRFCVRQFSIVKMSAGLKSERMWVRMITVCQEKLEVKTDSYSLSFRDHLNGSSSLQFAYNLVL